MAPKPNRIAAHKSLIHSIYWLTRGYYKTFKFEIVNNAPLLNALQSGQRILLCAWHQQILTGTSYFQRFRNYSPMIMISRSRDGDVAAAVTELLGWTAVRGSSSKGGFAGLYSIIKQLRKGQLAAHIVDGPRGPAGRVKAGAIQLASVTKAAIVPLAMSTNRAWYLNSWDHFMIPKPFAKVTIHCGDPWQVGRVRDETALEEKRRQLEEKMRPGLMGFKHE
jgi:lysophospholipid acyltransferase (LPLAT)-like uncharacterized protein